MASDDCLHILSVLLPYCSYRFPDLFPDAEAVRAMQQELDSIIQKGVLNITQLLRAGMGSESEETGNVKFFNLRLVYFYCSFINCTVDSR